VTNPPVRIRYRIPLTIVPIVAGVATAIPLWQVHAEPEFFSRNPDLPMVGGSLAVAVAAFAVVALFGTSGMVEEDEDQ
jgi:hypothetical protein